MYSLFKRTIDVIIAIVALVLLLPVFLPVIILLLISAEHHVFYRQERIGRNGRVFGILKFATMLKNSATMGNGLLTVRNDPRITAVGKWLRITKLNEFPQLWNVLVGDMSFVGPRPLTPIGITRYSDEVRLGLSEVRPGITGMGSLVFRDEEKLVSIYKEKGHDPKEYYRSFIFPYKGQIEMWYLKHQTFKVDLYLLLATIYSILTNDREIAYKLFEGLPKRPEILTVEYLQKL
jgi:lipopolysaccharide/colanic/teichoic acid biosynthesis glycosyltransferase